VLAHKRKNKFSSQQQNSHVRRGREFRMWVLRVQLPRSAIRCFIYFRCVFLIHTRNPHRAGASVQRPQSWVNTAEKMPTGCRAPTTCYSRLCIL
jgi:hypothetical protein